MEQIQDGPIKFFNDNEYLQKYGLNASNIGGNEKIKLTFSIINSQTSLYSIQAKLYGDQVLDFFSEKKQGNFQQQLPFEKFFICDFCFEKEQNLKIIVNKDNQKISTNVTLGYILGSSHFTYTYKLNDIESLMIKAERFGNYNYSLKFKFKLKMIENNIERNTFSVHNKIYYIVSSGNTKLYLSEIIKQDGTFELVHIPICLLQPFYTVTFYMNKQYLGSFNKSVQEIKQTDIYSNNAALKIPINNNRSIIIFDNSEKSKNYTFIDYINAGIQIALSVGIDFTGSNGHPLDDGSLHCLTGNTPNAYERAITSCGSIVALYAHDQLFPVYGFGAIINDSPNKQANMCFNLNFTNNPEIQTITNVIKVYHECIQKNKLTFAGPTYFAPLLKKVISRIKNMYEYHIIMILTDGVIDDLQETVDVLVEASLLPLSVIIIGIGDKDFSKMDILDGDTNTLISSTGKVRLRDLVQFVPFSKFQNDEKKLAMEVLAEIPRQMIEYFQFKDLNPEIIRNKKSGNVNQIYYDNVRQGQNNNNINTARNYPGNNNYYPNNNNVVNSIYKQSSQINNNQNNYCLSQRGNRYNPNFNYQNNNYPNNINNYGNNNAYPKTSRNSNQFQSNNNIIVDNPNYYSKNNNYPGLSSINNNNYSNINNNNPNNIINNKNNNYSNINNISVGINNINLGNNNNNIQPNKGKINLDELPIEETIYLNQNNLQNQIK